MNIPVCLPADDFERLYLARRIIRASERPRGRSYKQLIGQADRRTLRMVEVYPLYSSRWGVAKAEQLTLEHLSTDGHLQ